MMYVGVDKYGYIIGVDGTREDLEMMVDGIHRVVEVGDRKGRIIEELLCDGCETMLEYLGAEN